METCLPPSPALAPPADLSPRAISLARAIDRLPPGEFMIVLTKPPTPLGWTVEIATTQTVRVMELGK